MPLQSHTLEINDQQPTYCSVCGAKWGGKPGYIPTSKCPGVKVFDWGKWGDLLTKKQLYDAGYQTGKLLPSPAGAVYREKSPGGIMWLYDAAQAIKRRPASEAQQAALAKAQKQAEQVHVCCMRCGRDIATLTRKRAAAIEGGLCEHCGDADDASEWAREMLAQPDQIRILDTETTGLYNAEAVEIAVMDGHGNTILNTRVKPSPEGLVRMVTKSNGRSATDIHGITPEMLADAPSFAEVYPLLVAALKDKTLIIYNYDFDAPILRGSIRQLKPELGDFPSDETILGITEGHCAMESYAAYVGEIRWWRERRGWGWSYKWQPLGGGDHSALGDCRATLGVLKEMARAANVQTNEIEERQG